MNDSPAARSSRAGLRLQLALVCLAATVPYLPTIDNYYVRDDFGVVQLLSSKPWDYFPQWFTSSWMDTIWGYVPDEIRPFPAVSYQLTSWVAPGEPAADHILNILLHAANALLVFALARSAARLGPWPSTLAALIFALLPNQAETVAWITGRVDSMPAFFYLASLLAYVHWRIGTRGGAVWYVVALLCGLVGLFTKQNVMTLAASIALYDLILAPGAPRITRKALTGVVPFAAMTAGYLWLRYELFGAVARGGRLTGQEVNTFMERAVIHWNRVAFGSESTSGIWPWVLLTLCFGVTLAAVIRLDRGTRNHVLQAGLYFGPLWWVIGLAPIFVAGYVSSRHAYLASVAWAMSLGVALHAVLEASGRRALRLTAAGGASMLIAIYTFQTRAEVTRWERMADVAEHSVAEIVKRTDDLPDGSLVLVDVPWRSWEWALPFAVQPPYSPTDLTRRLFIVWPRGIDCCQGLHWRDTTQSTVKAWADQPAPGPVLGLHVNVENGDVSSLSDAEDPALNGFARLLIPLQHPDDLDRTLTAITTRLVAGHPAP